ncbi:MAG: 4a-hydroxytetrahydrobiopterin dehydratase [Ignavibacteriales bacterium]|nr:MAG: 4a-hydroxytetrahydrobiopterin dehydratase [Ignavibacteriales bacterium]
MNKLTEEEILSKLQKLSGWNYTGKSIQKEFKLENFISAVNFINKIAEVAERIDHHPDINLHSYNKVTITLTTHSKGGVTENDFKLAESIEPLFFK